MNQQVNHVKIMGEENGNIALGQQRGCFLLFYFYWLFLFL